MIELLQAFVFIALFLLLLVGCFAAMGFIIDWLDARAEKRRRDR